MTAQATQEAYKLTYDAQGHITAGTLYQPNWTESTDTKSDYILNKPNVYKNTTSNTGVNINRAANAATGANSVAMGMNTTASGSRSFAHGGYTTASGTNSHAEGQYTTASGNNSHAEGDHTVAASA